MARPRKEFSEEKWRQFETLCGIMCTRDEICAVLDVTDKTLGRLVKEKYKMTFEAARERFSAHGKASLRRLQFQHATTNPSMAMFLGKVYLNQNDRPDLRVSAMLEMQQPDNLFPAVLDAVNTLKKQKAQGGKTKDANDDAEV
jgi:sorbitol-specific phosphotransferase system component IIC